MKKFIIARHVPGAGLMNAEELKEMAKTSVTVITVLGKPYNWVQSYVTDDKIYCIHEADSKEEIVQHSSCADFPVEYIEEVKTVISPLTAELEV